MSTSELPSAGGGESTVAVPAWQQTTLAIIHRRTVGELDDALICDAYDFAKGHIPELITLPGLTRCTIAAYRDIDAKNQHETGGGLQFGYESDFRIGVRVPVYHLVELAVRPDDPFDEEQAEIIARAVSNVSMFSDLEDLPTYPDLTSCRSEPEPTVVYARRKL